MNTKFDFAIPETARTVYVRAVAHADLPKELQAQVDPTKAIYAIHDQNGECLALAKDRKLAFAIARGNEMAPVSVH